jgi:hypothetical protein
MSTDERFLLMYFHSHDPVKYEHHVNVICKDLGWGEGKYYKNRRLLVSKGWLETEEVRKIDKATGKKTVTGLRAKINLTAHNRYLENRSKCRLSAPSKSVPLSKTIDKGASPAKAGSSGEVIDHQDEM